MSWIEDFQQARAGDRGPLERGGPLEREGHLERDIDDELMFHLRALVDDNLRRGMTADEAWAAAERRFGSLTAHRTACHREHAAPTRTITALVVAVLLLVGMVGWFFREVQQLRDERDAAVVALIDAEGLAQENTLEGRVLDADGRPIAASDVLVIVKSWPGGHYRQRAFATRTGDRGNFHVAYRVPANGPYAVQIAAIKNGYAFASAYHWKKDVNEPLEAVTLQLPAAAPLTLVVQDDRGLPVPGIRVVPSARRSARGEDHAVYFQGSAPAHLQGDKTGRVHLGCFEWGDQAEVYVQAPGQDWRLHTIDIPPSGQEIIVQVAGGGS